MINTLISFGTLKQGCKMPLAHQRWSKQIDHLKQVGLLKNGQIYSEDDLDKAWWDRFGKYTSDHGFAYWGWKPYLIKQHLDKMEYGESFCYFDGGCVFPEDEKQLEDLAKKIDSKIQEMKDGGFDIGLTRYGPVPDGKITRQEIVDKLGLTGNNDYLYKFPHWQATLMLLSKTQRLEQLINDWNQFFWNNYETCIHFPYWDRVGQIPGFIHNGADQAILQCLLFKGQYKIMDLNGLLMFTTKRNRR